MDADRCVMCGEIIPEGRQVCPNCEARIMEHPFVESLLRDFEEAENDL